MSLIENTPNNGMAHASGLASDTASGADSIGLESTMPPEFEDRKKKIEWHTAEEVARAILWQHKDYTVLVPVLTLTFVTTGAISPFFR